MTRRPMTTEQLAARDKLVARYAASQPARDALQYAQVKTWYGDLWNADTRSIDIVARDLMKRRGKRVVSVGSRTTGLWIHVTLDSGKQVMLTDNVLKSHAWRIAR